MWYRSIVELPKKLIDFSYILCYNKLIENHEFVSEINGGYCGKNKRLSPAFFDNAENRVIHLWWWICHDRSA